MTKAIFRCQRVGVRKSVRTWQASWLLLMRDQCEKFLANEFPTDHWGESKKMCLEKADYEFSPLGKRLMGIISWDVSFSILELKTKLKYVEKINFTEKQTWVLCISFSILYFIAVGINHLGE